MTKISKTLLVLGSVAILSGCGMKSTYAKFKEKAEAAKAHEFTKCVVKINGTAHDGILKGGAWIPAATADLADTNVLAAFFAISVTAKEFAAIENQKATYYVNNLGYKYVDDEGNVSKAEWNKYGLLISASYDEKASDNNDYKYSVSYKK